MESSRDPIDRLRGALDSSWAEALEGRPAEALVEGHERARAATEEVVAAAADNSCDEPDGANDEVAAALESLETDARAFLRDSSLAPDVAARALSILRARARLLRRTVRAVEGHEFADETPFQLVELREVENGLSPDFWSDPGDDAAEAKEERAAEEIRARVARARLDVLIVQAERELSRSSALGQGPVDVDSAASAFRTFRALDAAEIRLAARVVEVDAEQQGELREKIERVTTERRRLRDGFFEFVSTVRTARGLKVLEGVGLELTGELDEARLTHVDALDEASIERLERLRALGDNFHRAFKAAAASLTDDERAVLEQQDPGLYTPRRVRRRLRVMTRRLKALAADLRLARRLERLFGRRNVQRWEAMIFWLIMAVLGLIVVQHHSDPAEPGTVPWTVWVDSGICFVLLFDFTVRLLLSPRRLDHFRRRFLTELIPSIPFGLIVNLENLGGLGVVRILRLGRVLRVLQLLRPAIRFFRLMLFVARASDRVVERNAWLLNHNIVFFTDAVKDEQVPTLLKRARELETWIARASAESLAALPASSRRIAADLRIRLLEAELTRADLRPVSAPEATAGVAPGRGAVKDLGVDDVIRTLRDLSPHRIAEHMGVDFARQVASSLRFFRLPLLRRLPVVRFVVGPEGVIDPLGTTARLGRVLGDMLAFTQRCVTWFADLYGSITGAQFLDRMGQQLVRAAERPAKRLVIFSVILGVALLLVKTTRLDVLDQVANALLRFLWGPVLLLGLVCLLPMSLGIWLRRIAGQAVDFYDRVAEAQFLGLTETVKEACADDYLTYLAERVMLPEIRLRDDVDEAERARLVERFVKMGLADPLVGQAGVRELSAFERAGFPHCASMFLFYRSFLDGAFFHANDTQIASMLLGNLTLENVRQNRLRYDRRARRRLERLDIGRGKGGVTGPYVWFNFITHSVSQLCARLILEYNRHCIPLDELPAAAPEDRDAFKAWLERRLRLSKLRRGGHATRLADDDDAVRGTLLYRTTEFNALHFLSGDPRRGEEVRERFGDMVADLMREDRENLVRTIFGTYPMQDLPKERRTFNPFRFYRRYFARGRVFFFPFVLLWFLLKGIKMLLARTIQIVKDVRNRDRRPLMVTPVRAGFEVARRKIHRMRRPVVLESLRLRAEFDVQYLGIPLPGRELQGWEGNLLADDLRILNASEREWQEFRELKSGRRRAVGRLTEQLRRHGGLEAFLTDVVRVNPHIAGREREAARAATTAYLCDHEGIRSATRAFDVLSARLAGLESEAGPKPSLMQRALFGRRTREAVAGIVSRLDVDSPRAEETEALSMAVLASRPELDEHVKALAVVPEGTPIDEWVRAVLLDVAEQPSSWSEQMVAVRTVQSLGMMDLLGYERLIETLGNFERREGRAESWREDGGLPRL